MILPQHYDYHFIIGCKLISESSVDDTAFPVILYYSSLKITMLFPSDRMLLVIQCR